MACMADFETVPGERNISDVFLVACCDVRQIRAIVCQVRAYKPKLDR